MKRFLNLLSVVFSVLLALQAAGQASAELIFKKPVLTSGTDKRVGATYRFPNVRPGTDALVTIAGASETQQLVSNIDVASTGWDKAFQPEIGKSGNVCSFDDWWVRFNLKFVYTNSNSACKLDKFYATAIDVDGDNSSVQEFIQVYGPDSVKSNKWTQLTQKTPFNAGLAANDKTNYHLGPVKNYANIDTAATLVMVTYTFVNVDEINIVYGAKVGFGSSNAGLRLNSLWFKAFDLALLSPLPVKNTSFVVTGNSHHANLQWTVAPNGPAKEFVVEKSSDGATFQPVAKLPAVDGKAAYQYTDASLSSASGVLYYRLLFVEQTGEGTYSDVKVLHLSKENGAHLRVYPNPARGAANVTLPVSWQNQPVTLHLFNSAGLQLQARHISRASQTEGLNMTTLPKGVYLIQAQCNGQVAQQRLVKE